MNYLDYIVLYFACGSPFATYYFFDHRRSEKFIWIKSFLILLLWIPYACKLLHFNVTKYLQNDSYKIKTLKINQLIKQFEQYLPENNPRLPLFEMREVLERYSELSFIKSALTDKPAEHEEDFYRINPTKKNVEIQSKCLNRRNRKRLFAHQTQARKDFLQVLEILTQLHKDQKNLFKTVAEFVKLIDDEEAQNLIRNLIQITGKPRVKDTEKELLWKPIQQKRLNAQTNLIPLPALTATINPPKKD